MKNEVKSWDNSTKTNGAYQEPLYFEGFLTESTAFRINMMIGDFCFGFYAEDLIDIEEIPSPSHAGSINHAFVKVYFEKNARIATVQPASVFNGRLLQEALPFTGKIPEDEGDCFSAGRFSLLKKIG